MRTVAELLAAKKDCTVHAVGPAASVFEAMEIMADKRIGALLVMDGPRVVGIVTERDYARKMALQARTARTTTVQTIMSAPVVYVRLNDSADRCLVLMAHNHLRHLPVLDGEKLVGMVSIRDLVDEIVADRRVLIDDIEHAVEARLTKKPDSHAPAAG